LKISLGALLTDVKNTESYHKRIHWLQDWFPEAVYDGVNGLCKLATLDEVKEQDDLLNPGRYVGVVIEDDGKTEEEFIRELFDLNKEIETLNSIPHKLGKTIKRNTQVLVGDNE
jgi:type I restriction enzyme M protein